MVAAKLSSAEIEAQVTSRFVDQIFEVALIDSPGTTYEPSVTDDAVFMADEVIVGTGGYQRKIIKYLTADVGGYADDGIGLARKAAIFTHNNSATTLDFSHVVMLRGDGNVLTVGSNTIKPSNGVNGTYTNIPTITAAGGIGLTVNLTVTSSGAALSNWAITINSSGYGYIPGESINISNAVLNQLGATTGTGNLAFPVATVTTGGQVVSVAKTDSLVVLGNGNQSVFYFDLKQFGYYDV
jgi:hypothetical protein